MNTNSKCKLAFDKLTGIRGVITQRDTEGGLVYVEWNNNFSGWIPEWLVDVTDDEKDKYPVNIGES